ncbi:MAG: hypothetical protein AB1393_08555 [Candidatus Edwardsbacteria bacterium]
MLSLLLCEILFGGCGRRNPLLFRLSKDYLPLTVGNSWEYIYSDGYTFSVVIDTTETKESRLAFRLMKNYQTEYWWKGEGDFAEYVSYSVYFGGDEYSVEKRWRKHLVLPLVMGNKWEDPYQGTTLIAGTTLDRESNLEGEVVGIEKINLPSGNFEECYKVHLVYSSKMISPLFSTAETLLVDEWYAPDVGLIKRWEKDKTSGEVKQYFLTKYSVKK